jgi:hypothetical protein
LTQNKKNDDAFGTHGERTGPIVAVVIDNPTSRWSSAKPTNKITTRERERRSLKTNFSFLPIFRTRPGVVEGGQTLTGFGLLHVENNVGIGLASGGGAVGAAAGDCLDGGVALRRSWCLHAIPRFPTFQNGRFLSHLQHQGLTQPMET